MFKKFLIIFILLFTSNTFASYKTPDVNALSAVLTDPDTGRVLWGKKENTPMAMASTTKIMTAIIALENSPLDKVITVSKNAASAPPVKMHLQTGEKITLKSLLYALLLESANDSAVAIAEGVAGSVENFCAMMNKKALEIGCSNTLFVTPNGLDKGDHHSTARDMSLIGAYAIKNPEFINISNTRSITITSDKKTYALTNKNRLLSSYEGALGIKTGFTGKAGHCFVGAASRDGVTLISVVLASGWGTKGKENKWSDTQKILDYGFDNYKKYSIIGEKTDICVDKAKVSNTTLKYEKSVDILLNESEYKRLKFENDLPKLIEAPVRKGEIIGKGSIYLDSIKLAEINIIATETIERHSLGTSFDKIIKEWMKLICS